MGFDVRIQVDGLDELKRALKNAPKDIRKEFKDLQKPIANQLLSEAVQRVPVKSGALRSSLKAYTTLYAAGVRSGNSKVQYGNFIHWGANGWPKASGEQAKHNNAINRKAKQRQIASKAGRDRKIEGTRFIWEPAKDMVDRSDEVLKQYEQAIDVWMKRRGLVGMQFD